MIRFAAHLWAGLSRPSRRDQTPEEALVRGLAHAVLGAALGLLLPWWAIIVFYGVFKELGDVRQGGSRLDSAFDSGFVAIGAVSFGGWPVAAIALGLAQAATLWSSRP